MLEAAQRGRRKNLAKWEAGSVASPTYVLGKEVKHDSC